MLSNLYLISGTLGIPSGGGGCAAHKPPHQKGRRQSAGNCKSVVAAVIKALCNEMRDAASGPVQRLHVGVTTTLAATRFKRL